jgi:hypothetical protein
LTTEVLSSQTTCNTKLVVYFLNFLVITHTLKSNNHGRSYDRWNTVHQCKNLGYSFRFGMTTISQNSADWIWCRIRRSDQYKSDREFLDLSIKHKYALIQPTVQKLRSLKFGGGVSSEQIGLSGQIWTVKPLLKEIWSKSELKYHRKFYNLSNDG